VGRWLNLCMLLFQSQARCSSCYLKCHNIFWSNWSMSHIHDHNAVVSSCRPRLVLPSQSGMYFSILCFFLRNCYFSGAWDLLNLSRLCNCWIWMSRFVLFFLSFSCSRQQHGCWFARVWVGEFHLGLLFSPMSIDLGFVFILVGFSSFLLHKVVSSFLFMWAFLYIMRCCILKVIWADVLMHW
jgi:hypothetical protein